MPNTDKWICRACSDKHSPGIEAEEITIAKLAPSPCAWCGEPTFSTILNPKPKGLPVNDTARPLPDGKSPVGGLLWDCRHCRASLSVTGERATSGWVFICSRCLGTWGGAEFSAARAKPIAAKPRYAVVVTEVDQHGREVEVVVARGRRFTTPGDGSLVVTNEYERELAAWAKGRWIKVGVRVQREINENDEAETT